MKIKSKATGKIVELINGSLYPKNAYDLVEEKTSNDGEQATTTTIKPTKAELFEKLKGLDPNTKFTTKNTVIELEEAISTLAKNAEGTGEAKDENETEE